MTNLILSLLSLAFSVGVLIYVELQVRKSRRWERDLLALMDAQGKAPRWIATTSRMPHASTAVPPMKPRTFEPEAKGNIAEARAAGEYIIAEKLNPPAWHDPETFSPTEGP